MNAFKLMEVYKRFHKLDGVPEGYTQFELFQPPEMNGLKPKEISPDEVEGILSHLQQIVEQMGHKVAA